MQLLLNPSLRNKYNPAIPFKMIKLLQLLVCSAVIATVLSLSDDMRELYRKTQAKYGLPVVSSSQEDSKQHFAEFCEFVRGVEKHNTEDPDGFVAEVNMFALMSRAERYDKWTGLNESDIMEQQRKSLSVMRGPVHIDFEKRQLQAAVDYTAKLPGVKQQGGLWELLDFWSCGCTGVPSEQGE